jgi:hypothetical protein
MSTFVTRVRSEQCTCGASVVWAKNRYGRILHLDATPNDTGHVIMDERRYVPHMFTCPNAALKQKKGGA